MISRIVFPLIVLSLFTGCVQNSQNAVIGAEKSQVALRAIQSKAFDTRDQQKTLRTIIATLQDLGFVIDRADSELGTVSGTKMDNYVITMSVTAQPLGKRMVVRANATYIPYNGVPMSIVDAKPYQDFYAALEKAMFLTAHEVE